MLIRGRVIIDTQTKTPVLSVCRYLWKIATLKIVIVNDFIDIHFNFNLEYMGWH